MRVPISWLRELCPTDLTPAGIAEALTRQGVEVDDVLYPWAPVGGVIVARVLEVRDHPGADKLCLATVDAGGVERDVVVGVRNMQAGDLVPYAPPGATLPGFEGPLERRTIRGRTSDGMLCSAKELAIGHEHTGILVIPGEVEPGHDLKDALGLDEAVIDIEVFPNRPDLLSMVGVAREVAAATGADLRMPAVEVPEGDEKASDAAWVEVADPVRCPRYVARVIRGVRNVPAPLEVRVRLVAGGMRPISAAVDATNYALMELGHPMHPFDLARLEGGGVVVRTAGEGERLVTLDDVERALTEQDLLIADRAKAVGVAGVMGSAAAEVGEETSDVLLESAYFQPRSILRTARRLGLRTEASVRFERGADPEALEAAAARASRLMTAWAGGTVLAGTLEVGDTPARGKVAIRPSRASLLVGVEVTAGEVREAFDKLGIETHEEHDRVEVEVPSFRVDLEREADLIEEVARIHGYADLPSTLPGVRQAGGLTRVQRLRRALRDALARAGLLETMSVSFLSPGDLEIFEDARASGVKVANPVSAEAGVLRTALLPGLLSAARRNLARGNGSVRLFEVGRVFDRGGPAENEQVGVLLAGRVAEEWPGEQREHDFLDARGVVEAVAEGLGVDLRVGEAAPAPYHPGRSSLILLGDDPIGEVGELHPKVAEAFDLPGRAAALELDADALVAGVQGPVVYRELSRFPPVRRDLAFVVGRDVPVGHLRASLVDAAGTLLERVWLFDVFEGAPVPEGAKSVAFSVALRASDRTLTDHEAAEVVASIAERLAADHGAELRSG